MGARGIDGDCLGSLYEEEGQEWRDGRQALATGSSASFGGWWHCWFESSTLPWREHGPWVVGMSGVGTRTWSLPREETRCLEWRWVKLAHVGGIEL